MSNHPRRHTHHHRIVSISRRHEHAVDGKREVRATFAHGFDASTAATAISAGSSVLFEVQSRTHEGGWIRTGWAFRGQFSSSLPVWLVAVRSQMGLPTDPALLTPCPTTWDADNARLAG